MSIDITELTGQSVFLAKVNRSQDIADYVDTGLAWGAGVSRSAADGRSHAGTDGRTMISENPAVSGVFPDGVVRLDYKRAQEFNRNHPPVRDSVRSKPLRSQLRAATAVVGDTRTFWVDNPEGQWSSIPAVLRAVGDNCNVWVADVNFDDNSGTKSDNKITFAQAQAIAGNFDTIYGLTTAIYGYEYGGGVSSSAPTYGGKDGDPKIQILVYDIDYDFFGSQKSGTLGYFWSKDFFTQEELAGNNMKTNLSEIFYVDAHFTDDYEDVVYSTLVHEFQHMINFNQKEIVYGKPIPETWYNEMLSMIAEDMISPLIGINMTTGGHPINVRIPTFLAGYNLAGVSEWLGGSEEYYSYSNVYAFGAFLARNFGGAELIKGIASNALTNMESISSELNRVNAGLFPSVNSAFTDALGLYAQAFLYSGSGKPSGAYTFDTTDSRRINNTNYTFTAFDIWKIPNAAKGDGPSVFDMTDYWEPMPGHSVLLLSYPEWQGRNGTLKIELERPASSDIDLYLMVR
ncbi:MAG: hypothetical protein LBU99_01485 [Spirochaetaceae bacterium]|jgi:hypothetical protein|nr:hypothetical protein [Spirochaetaceae bacterium]